MRGVEGNEVDCGVVGSGGEWWGVVGSGGEWLGVVGSGGGVVRRSDGVRGVCGVVRRDGED